MTITLEFKTRDQVSLFKAYMEKLYDHVDIYKEYIPGTISYNGTTVQIYMTDEFFDHSYQYFLNALTMAMEDPEKADHIETLFRVFRRSSEQMFMCNILNE